MHQLLKYLPARQVEIDIFAARVSRCETVSLSELARMHLLGPREASSPAVTSQADFDTAQAFAEALASHDAFRKQRFDIIHTHHWKATLILPFVRANMPESVTVHTPHLLAGAKAAEVGVDMAPCVLEWERCVLSSVDRLILVSTAELQNLLQICPRADSRQMAIIPNGFDHLLPVDIRRTAPSGRELRLLSIGRMSRHKNWLFLLEMMREAKVRGCRWHLTLLGGSYDRDYEVELRHFLNLHTLHSVVDMPGYVGPELLRTYLSNSHIYLHAAFYESQGIALGEAMSSGLPCVVTDSMGLRDFFRDGVHGAIVASPWEAFNAVCTLAAQPQRYQRIAEMNRSVRREFTWHRTVTRTVEVYREAIAAKHPRFCSYV